MHSVPIYCVAMVVTVLHSWAVLNTCLFAFNYTCSQGEISKQALYASHFVVDMMHYVVRE